MFEWLQTENRIFSWARTLNWIKSITCIGSNGSETQRPYSIVHLEMEDIETTDYITEVTNVVSDNITDLEDKLNSASTTVCVSQKNRTSLKIIVVNPNMLESNWKISFDIDIHAKDTSERFTEEEYITLMQNKITSQETA